MIKEFERLHGAALTRLIHESSSLNIQLFEKNSNSGYLLNGTVGLYIKHATARMSPWRFTFQKKHQDDMLRMQRSTKETFLVLICGEDGIVALSFKEIKKVLDKNHEAIEWLSASRKKREKYTIKGSDGKLEYKIGEIEFASKILNALPPESKVSDAKSKSLFS